MDHRLVGQAGPSSVSGGGCVSAISVQPVAQGMDTAGAQGACDGCMGSVPTGSLVPIPGRTGAWSLPGFWGAGGMWRICSPGSTLQFCLLCPCRNAGPWVRQARISRGAGNLHCYAQFF